MRIPTSMIVMGVITAIPFGLAIRQTLHKSASADRDIEESLDPSLKYERETEAQVKEADLRYEQERLEVEQKKQKQRMRQLDIVGPTPASLGGMFDGIALGAARDGFNGDELTQRIEQETESNIEISFETDVKALAGVRVKIGGYSRECSDFSDTLKKMWGPSQFGSSDRHTWVTENRRAVFEVNKCELVIERFADVASWIGHGDASVVPLDAIGKSAKALAGKLGPSVDSDETMMTWQQVGVGGGTGMTTISATIENDKIKSISVDVNVDVATRSDLEERLTKLFGAPKEYPPSGADLGWSGRPPVELSTRGKSIELRIGK